MIDSIKGLHHVTSLASDANQNNRFFTQVLGQRRIKKTVNFDAPEVYHLYYGDEVGTPGSVMTFFPFGNMQNGVRGTGEVGVTEFAVPKGALDFWEGRLAQFDVRGLQRESFLGASRLAFEGPDGDSFALVETAPDTRTPWTSGSISSDVGIRGFHGARLRVRDGAAIGELLHFMGYQRDEMTGGITRYRIEDGNGANVIDVEALSAGSASVQGAGSVHHIAFAVDDRAAQDTVRKALMDTGYQVTPVIDRDYFYAIYFRSPGGVLFEIATNEPGFDRDEDVAHLGSALKLPTQYEPLRDKIEALLPEIED
ncbi:MAG: VOC family protein [Cognatishimia sp.]